uniref:BPI2 domain-containing protein n=1 Tax=Heterorhabditis bacteriophora TaxID=37862 RepID=A0A1I7XS02_HETBA
MIISKCWNNFETVGVKLLNEQIAKLSGYNTSFPFSQPGIEGFVTLHNVKILQYNPPQVSVVNFLPPRFIVFGLENMDVSLMGNFIGSGGPFHVTGTVDGSLVAMTVALTVEFSSTEDGQMVVQVPNCSTIIGRSHFNINPEGPMGPLVKTMEGFINDGIRQRIPGMFCKKLKHLIEENSPRIFSRLTKTNFEDHFKGELTENTVIKKFIANFVKGLYVDNKNIAHPVVTNEYFETQQKGEIRYEDNAESTPFYPKPMVTRADSDRMMYFYGSDYLFNSLLYHAYQTNKLSIKWYPNTTTSFVLIPHGLPDFQFNGDAGAIKLSTRIITYVDDHGHQKQIMVSSSDGQADVQLYATNGRFSGDLKLSVQLHRTSLPGVDPSSIEQLTPLAKTFLGPQLSQGLKKGVPFPLNARSHNIGAPRAKDARRIHGTQDRLHHQ